MRRMDLAGQRFGRLTVVCLVDAARPTRWSCACDCGAAVSVAAHCLRNGDTKSCGCLSSERFRSHGRSGTPTHKSWVAMKIRCTYPSAPNFHRYGGRGISVCERWLKFENFLADMGERPSADHSLDRINNDGNYEPGNCRWATRKEQARNTPNVVLITINGRTQSRAAWLEEAGIPYPTFQSRVRDYGYSPEEAIALGRRSRGGSR